ncbi:phage tail protein [Pasteurella multocida]|nr:phage tail protein [Pasteurella multocida]HDR1874090.1 phage tail protein [Pasteurella multocida]HDR1894450.1 phage tail protein [Pasteurella multocida]HED4406653.1 phage tail protein [Pasteurella multocida]
MSTLASPELSSYIARQVTAGQTVVFDEIIFCNIPNLTANNLADHLTFPDSEKIVHRQVVSQIGFVNENAVVYSITMGTEIGDFDFNYIGLINRNLNLLAVGVYTNTIKKIKNKNGIQGNAITRSILLEFDNAKQVTNITIPAETWQIDFTMRLSGIDEKIRLTNRDLYGRAAFFNDGFLLKRNNGNKFTINAGVAYVEGVRAHLSELENIQLSLPCSVYLDVVHHCTVTGAYQTELTFLKQQKDDYKDGAGKQHYVQILAEIDRNGNITDRRLLPKQYIPNDKKSDDINSNSSDTVATSAAVKKAFDLADSKQSPQTTLEGYGIADFKNKTYTSGNADDIKTSGCYFLEGKQNFKNLPRPENWHVWVRGDDDRVYQIAKLENSTETQERYYYQGNWTAWKRTDTDGLPVGSIVAFPKEIVYTQGFLLAEGGDFNRETYPDLYKALSTTRLPNLKRSDVGMTAYFPFNDIPSGWIAFDSIRTEVTQQKYPELYQYLVEKYGAISNVPLAEDRFIRSSGNGLNVGQTQEDAIRNIKGEIDLTPLSSGNQFLEFESSRNQEIFKGAILPNRASWVYWSADQGHGAEMPRGFKFDASAVVPTANENRPKAIALKLCIKVKNKFDDVRFWIKAFGAVENLGSLDAGALAQDLQQIRIKTQQIEESFEQNKTETDLKIEGVEQKINNTKIESNIVWSGNVTQNSTNIIQLQSSVLNKRLTLYLQSSSVHSLSNNDNVHITSVYVDKYSLEVAGKKYIHGAMYAGGWRNVQLELVEENKIKLIDTSGFFLKQITAI